MKNISIQDNTYTKWVKELKNKIRTVQIKAAVKVNSELLNFYWELGADIIKKQKTTKWGDSFIGKLSRDLLSEFPDIKGFSTRNLHYIRQWYQFYSTSPAIVQQAVAQLSQIPWGHNVVIISKTQSCKEALFYVQKTIQNNWSRAVLTHQIESNLFKRHSNAITNFATTLPTPQSDLARETTKDPYNFDFLTLTEKFNEIDLENALINHVTKFLLELGAGFSFIGRQYPLEVNGDDFFIDLLFYHVKLHCYVVVELKAVKFQPEFTGKLNFYVSAVDEILKSEQDNPTIGILICKSKNNTVVEYSLKDIQKPIGVSEYIITENLPDEFKSSLPGIEEIEAELNDRS
jgi:predicted nuclease of restriction endonuclease-like (RecB) superfamily